MPTPTTVTRQNGVNGTTSWHCVWTSPGDIVVDTQDALPGDQLWIRVLYGEKGTSNP